MTALLLPVYSLWSREMKRFYRQPSRVVGALASPLMFWLLIGSGIGTSFRAGSGARTLNYSEYFFPGTVLMILLFTAIFSTISLIEDRREGFMQSVLVAPVSRSAIVLGKILGGTSLAVTQGALFLVLAPFIGIHPGISGWLEVTGVMVLGGFGMTALGFIIAWRMNSIQGFHAIMNLFLMPLWMLSGALFPPDGAPVWLRWVMAANPLTYTLAALRHALYRGHTGLASLPPFGFSMTITAVFGFVLFALATGMALQRRPEAVG